jgi:hypothetical protein
MGYSDMMSIMEKSGSTSDAVRNHSLPLVRSKRSVIEILVWIAGSPTTEKEGKDTIQEQVDELDSRPGDYGAHSARQMINGGWVKRSEIGLLLRVLAEPWLSFIRRQNKYAVWVDYQFLEE